MVFPLPYWQGEYQKISDGNTSLSNDRQIDFHNLIYIIFFARTESIPA